MCGGSSLGVPAAQSALIWGLQPRAQLQGGPQITSEWWARRGSCREPGQSLRVRSDANNGSARSRDSVGVGPWVPTRRSAGPIPYGEQQPGLPGPGTGAARPRPGPSPGPDPISAAKLEKSLQHRKLATSAGDSPQETEGTPEGLGEAKGHGCPVSGSLRSGRV